MSYELKDFLEDLQSYVNGSLNTYSSYSSEEHAYHYNEGYNAAMRNVLDQIEELKNSN